MRTVTWDPGIGNPGMEHILSRIQGRSQLTWEYKNIIRYVDGRLHRKLVENALVVTTGVE